MLREVSLRSITGSVGSRTLNVYLEAPRLRRAQSLLCWR